MIVGFRKSQQLAIIIFATSSWSARWSSARKSLHWNLLFSSEKSTLEFSYSLITAFPIYYVCAGSSVYKRTAFLGVAVLGVFCLTVVLPNQRDGSPLRHHVQSRSVPVCSCEDANDTDKVDISNEIQQVLDEHRRTVHDEMTGYPYPNGKYNISATKFEDLAIEENGKPVRSVIISTYRSGSNFLAEIIGSHPGNYHHAEPLADFGGTQIRGPPLSTKAMKNIRGLFQCDYTVIDNLTLFETDYGYVFNKSRPSWWRCHDYPNMCYDQRYLSGVCKLFPFQSMKLVRLRLRIAQDLLADENLAVRLVLLVRDPRGSVASRKRLPFYDISPEISDPALLCADLVADYKVAVKLQEKYPDTFRVLRYEDLAADPFARAEELLKFYGREFHPKVREFLDTHTRSKSGGLFSTFRNTRTTPYHWRMDLTFKEVEEIQRTCATAMEYWGYLPAMNATHQREFDPVTDYVLRL